MKVTEKKEVSLSKWLELYASGVYRKVEIEDGITMNGYIFVGTGTQNSMLLFGSPTVTDDFVLVTSKKPLDTSITEL